MRLVAAALVVFALSAAPAMGSWVVPPVTSQSLLDRYLPIARAAWPGSPCEGQERVTLDDDAEIDAAATELEQGATGLAFGLGVTDPTSPDYCRIGMSAVLVAHPDWFCVVLTHELGHLAGLGHSDIPGDVMNVHGTTYPPCDTPTRRDSLDALLRLGLPRPNAWTFSCAAARRGAIGCTASAPFAKHTRHLVLSPELLWVSLPRRG